jgi:hypothetical protein
VYHSSLIEKAGDVAVGRLMLMPPVPTVAGMYSVSIDDPASPARHMIAISCHELGSRSMKMSVNVGLSSRCALHPTAPGLTDVASLTGAGTGGAARTR